MNEFIGHIADIGPSGAPNGRARARIHILAAAEMHRHPFHRHPGEALCNPNLRLGAAELVTDPAEHEVSCTKCRSRGDHYDVMIVAPPRETAPTAAGRPAGAET